MSRRRHSPRRRLERLVGLLLLFESAMYAAISPLLPHYAHALHASRSALGLLSAAYAAGLVLGAPLGGRLAQRAGVRSTTLAGLVGFGAAVAPFGLADSVAALDALRALQGIFCGLIWGGALSWLIAEAPRERRGAALGGVIGAASFGTLLGPLIGSAAVTVGARPVFAAVGAVALALAIRTARAPQTTREPVPGSEPTAPAAGPATGGLRAARADGELLLGAWLISLEAAVFGAAGLLVPLRLAALGASGVAIGATFAAASGVSAMLSGVVGRASDRHGPARVASVGLLAGAPLVAVVLLPSAGVPLAGLAILALGVPMTAGIIPAAQMMTAAAERAALPLTLAPALVNLAYAIGDLIGAPAAGGISQSAGEQAPFLLLGGLMVATGLRLRRGSRRAAPAPRGAVHTAGGPRALDSERRPGRRDPRRAHPPHRSPAVRLGPGSAPLRPDPADADVHPAGTTRRV